MLRLFQSITGPVFLLLAISVASYAAEPVRIDNLTFNSGQMTYRAESIELEGVNLSAESMEALLHGTDIAAQAKALSTLDAAMIKVSRLRQTQTVGDQATTTIFSNVSLANIKSGIVARLKAESSTFGTVANTAGASSGSTGSITLDDIDLSLLVGYGAAVKDKKSDEFHRAYSHAEITKIAFQSPKAAIVTIDRISIGDVQLRNSGDGLTAISERLVKRQNDAGQSDADVSATLIDVVDIFSSISTGMLEFENISVRDAETPTNFVNVNRIQYSGGVSAEASSYRIDGVDVEIEDFHLKIGNFGQSGIKLSPVFQALHKALAKPNAKAQEIDPSLFLPLIGRLELHDAVLDANLDGPKKFGARSVVFALETANSAPPNQIELSFDGLSGPLPTDTTDSTIQTITALGYRDLNLSGGVKANLDPKTQELDFNANISSQNMANIALSSRFGNISAESLIASPSNAPITLMGASLKSFRIMVENRGLVERLIDQQAIKTKRTADQVRASYASAAAASLQIYLGMSENAKGITKTLVSFVNNPNKLMISGQSKKPAGVTIADTATGDGPAAILDLFDLQREPQ
ncbi:MAG: hypothetical protein ORN52_12920 [Beijerinckiaceae bacterium]|nr:hypothetical protein [Beijerinckiaceae bacterium]